MQQLMMERKISPYTHAKKFRKTTYGDKKRQTAKRPLFIYTQNEPVATEALYFILSKDRTRVSSTARTTRTVKPKAKEQNAKKKHKQRTVCLCLLVFVLH